ncbi:TnsA-like heteromeric transposase endonuclease subunit [Streptomyces sp. NPDC051322]|uniref:TnsA-like heteromeric transposase endonuclease subunit n=1 Tax=Streptomyces sp. NPDC051322 TaxID=3154645 RepID=UPI00344F1E49
MRRDRRARVVDVRAEDSVDERTTEAFAATERACWAVGWEFVHVGVPDAVVMANLRWLARCRHGRCGRETDVAERLVEVFRQPQGLRTGAEDTGNVLRVLPVLFHLLWAGTLRAALGGALLSSGTVVHASGGSAVGLQRRDRGHGLLRSRPDTRGEGSQTQAVEAGNDRDGVGVRTSLPSCVQMNVPSC